MQTNHFLQLNQPPFDVLTTKQREQLANHAKVSYLDKDTAIPNEWAQDFFVIIKGSLKQFKQNELIAGLNRGDWFNLIDSQGEQLQAITSEQSLLYRLNGQIIKQISEQNANLKDLLFADLSKRKQHYNNRKAYHESQTLLYRLVGELGEHIKKPNFIISTASLYDATLAMNTANAKHILVQDTLNPQRVGVFTQTDVCRAITDKADFYHTHVIDYTKFDIYQIDEQQEVSEALLLMLDKNVHRLPVVNETGEIVGVLGQTELLHFLTNHSQIIFAKIEQAKNLDDLSIAVQMIGKFIRNQAEIGAKVQGIGRAVQSVNIQVFKKVWQLIVPQQVFDNTCIFVMGSEGRGEQIMRSNQNNAMLIRDGFDDKNLTAYANQFNNTLAELGYPYSQENIMINSSHWRQYLSDFQAQVQGWFQSADIQAVTSLATLFDAHFVCGDKNLLDTLMNDVFTNFQTSAHSNFIQHFAMPTIQMGDGATFWQKFTGGQDSDIDLKKAGLFPIVHGVRTLCLEYGIKTTSTKSRLAQLSERQILDEQTAQNLLEALDFFLSKRLEVSLTTSDKSARKVNPNQLSSLERDLLKESLAVVKKFKEFITQRYQLEIPETNM